MYRLIQIEPDDTAHRAVRQALAEGPLGFAVERARDPAEASALAGDRAVDAVLLALAAQSDPAPAIDACRAAFATQPLIVLTEAADLSFAQAALRAGAQDVVVRHERALAVLSRIVLYAIERAGAEVRRRDLEARVAQLTAVLDALFAHSGDAVLQVDAAGTIERLSPPAASLIGSASPPPMGCNLGSRLRRQDVQRLLALLRGREGSLDHSPTTFTFSVAGATRLIELQPLPLGVESEARPHLLKLTELVAEFACEADPATPPAPGPAPRPSAPAATTERQPPARSTTAARPQDLIEALGRTATWRVAKSAGADACWGFLVPDQASAAAVAQLAAAGRDDPDVALAFDRLQLRAWRNLATDAPSQMPQHPALVASYGTCASRAHLERFVADAAAMPDGMAKKAQLVLDHVPDGIYVPTLAKSIRTLGTGQAKPALHLRELESDYRELALSQLAILIIEVEALKRALAKSGKAVAALLARARQEGCRTMVRGAAGPLAEALRSRLGIDLTVEA